MGTLTKPKCPICDGNVHYDKLSLSISSGDGSPFSGGYKRFGYRCENDNANNWCSVARDGFNIMARKPDNKLGALDSPIDNWRELLKRFHHYVEFAEDNHLKFQVRTYFPDGNVYRAGGRLEDFLRKFELA